MCLSEFEAAELVEELERVVADSFALEDFGELEGFALEGSAAFPAEGPGRLAGWFEAAHSWFSRCRDEHEQVEFVSD